MGLVLKGSIKTVKKMERVLLFYFYFLEFLLKIFLKKEPTFELMNQIIKVNGLTTKYRDKFLFLFLFIVRLLFLGNVHLS